MLIFKISFIFSSVISEANHDQNMYITQPFKSKICLLMESFRKLNIPENPIFLPNQDNDFNRQFFMNLMGVLERGNYIEFQQFFESTQNYTLFFVNANTILMDLKSLYRFILKIFNESPCFKEILSELLNRIYATMKKIEEFIYNEFGSFENYCIKYNSQCKFFRKVNESIFNSQHRSVFLYVDQIKDALTLFRNDINSLIRRYNVFYVHSWKNKRTSLKGLFIYNTSIFRSYISSLMGINHMDRVFEFFYNRLMVGDNSHFAMYSLFWLKDFGESVMIYLKKIEENEKGLYPQTDFTQIIENCNVTLNIINNDLKICNQKNNEFNDIKEVKTLELFLHNPEEFKFFFLSLNERLQCLIGTIENNLRIICGLKKEAIDKYIVDIDSLRDPSDNFVTLNAHRSQIYERIEQDFKHFDEEAKTYYFYRQILLSCLIVQKNHFLKVIYIINSFNLDSPNIPEALKERYASLKGLVNVELIKVEKRIFDFRMQPNTDNYFSIFHDPIVEYYAELYKIRMEMLAQ